MRRRKVLTGPDSVLGSIFNQVHTRSNSLMTVKGCPDGHSNFSEEGVWAEEDMSVEEEKNGQEKKGGRQRSRERESKQVGKSGGEEIDKDKVELGMADGSHRSQDDLDS